MKAGRVDTARHPAEAVALCRRFLRRTFLEQPQAPPSPWRDAMTYVATAAVCVTFLVFHFSLWRVSLRVPLLEYGGDTLFYMELFKGMTEGGWYLGNPAVGAPLGLNIRDFPLTETWHFAWCKLLAIFIKDAAVVYNLYYLLGFPLAGLTATFMLRRLAVGRGAAVVAACLFAFLPFHLQRFGHLFITSYYLLPLLTLACLKICTGTADAGSQREGEHPARKGRPWRDFLGSAAVCVMVGLSKVYLAFFSCWLLIAAGLVSVVNRRKLLPLCTAGLLAVVTVSAVAVSVLPSLRYWKKQGPNPAAVRRSPGEADICSLKLIQMLLPQFSHRVPLLRQVANYYRETFGWTMTVNENATASLGIVGSIGLLYLLGRLACFRGPQSSSPLLNSLSFLTLFVFAMATMGGLASLVGLMLYYFNVPFFLRAYNRASVPIGLLALTAVAILLDRLGRWCSQNRAAALAFRCLLLAVLVVGLLDQTGKFDRAAYQEFKRVYRAEARYVEVVESMLAPGAMVLQLPYRSFPENPERCKDWDYDGFRPYLHSKSLRWSYGAMRGREADRLVQGVSTLPPLQLVDAAGRAGFGAVLVDRRGLADEGRGLEGELRTLLGAPVEGVDGRYACYKIEKTPDAAGR